MFVLKMAHDDKTTKQSSSANLSLKWMLYGDTNMHFDFIIDFYFVYTVTFFLHYS